MIFIKLMCGGENTRYRYYESSTTPIRLGNHAVGLQCVIHCCNRHVP